MPIRYEFSYTEPVQSTDDNGQPITIQMSRTFALGGVTEMTAKCIRFGLRRGQQLGYLSNVSCSAIDETKTAVTGDPA